jgi:hypothetical protein
VPAPPLHFLGRSVEDVQDVRRLAIAHLDPECVHEHQPVEPVAALHRQLGGKPATEREAHQGQLLVRQRVEEFEIEMDEVVDRFEVLRARGAAEPGVRGRNDLGVPTEHFQKRGARIDRLHPVEQQHRSPGAAAQHFQIDSAHDVAR